MKILLNFLTWILVFKAKVLLKSPRIFSRASFLSSIWERTVLAFELRTSDFFSSADFTKDINEREEFFKVLEIASWIGLAKSSGSPVCMENLLLKPLGMTWRKIQMERNPILADMLAIFIAVFPRDIFILESSSLW